VYGGPTRLSNAIGDGIASLDRMDFSGSFDLTVRPLPEPLEGSLATLPEHVNGDGACGGARMPSTSTGCGMSLDEGRGRPLCRRNQAPCGMSISYAQPQLLSQRM
jgi:hypothetical protein